ncbi:hypothetical protein VSS74_13850 [Conexibacter stalactiti]|uniref:Uncharacterized protein n=1 Tax=Conexibacter stalactiti TaxID=1940611 RepID=A0ABU4HQ33_9ACTN|nr:hypothetical protein [Conexibacter stalactiti]MDW5595428.1 hypothetical protein [Conexibacter stalactiti]MEC5036070.1 hypothetical protein [Conexibacter stalactiti]
MRLLLSFPLLLLALAAAAIPVTAPAVAGAAAPAGARQGPTKQRCPQDTVPIVRERGRKLVPVRDRRGRLRCRALAVGKPPAPSATAIGQAGTMTDALHRAQAIDPRASARLERALGRRGARRIVDVTLDGWKRAAAAAGATRAAAAGDGDTETTTFAPHDGVRGSLTIGMQEVSGADSGSTTTATATVEASRDGITELAPGLTDKLAADLERVRGEARVSFEDKIAACPSDRGERRGSVKARGSVKITVERDGKPPLVVEQSVEAEFTYTSRADGTLDVEVRTTFQSSGSGVPTQTYRGRRLGRGFGRDAILDSRDVEGALRRDAEHFDDSAGGVFGPKGGWNYARGIGYSDLRSIDNIKAMVTAAVHTDLLMLAGLEYARKVALKRADREECGYTVALNVDGRGVFATHDAAGQIAVTVPAREVGENAWTATGPLTWNGLVFTTKHECGYVAPVGDGGTFTVELDRTDEGRLRVTWSYDRAIATASVDCPSTGSFDPPPVPGQPGPGLPGIGPMSFELPLEGGSQVVTGGVQDSGEGFFNDGVLTVARVR